MTAHPHAYAAWFTAAPHASVSAIRLRFDAAGGGSTLVGLGPDLEALAQAMRRNPPPGTRGWRVGPVRGRIFTAYATWEGAAPGGNAARVVWETFGDDALVSFTMRADHAIYRALLPDGADASRLWPGLRAEIERARLTSPAGVRCEIERLAQRSLRPDSADPEFLPVVECGLGMGAFDHPPASTAADVAAFLGLEPQAVESYLLEASVGPIAIAG